MGQGIGCAIPLAFKVRQTDMNEDYFPAGFFDCYEFVENNPHINRVTSGDSYFEIKPEILTVNFKSFFTGFTDIVCGENPDEDEIPWIYSEWDAFDQMAKENYIQKFKEFFDKDRGYAPYYDDGHMHVSVPYIDIYESIFFYKGSYKAFLEFYITLVHMDRLLIKALPNPLSIIAKFCMFG